MSQKSINEPLRDDSFRQNTFTRGFTLGGNDGFRRGTTGFGRTLTETIGLTYTSEEQWTKSLISQYTQIADKGVDGDMPLPAGFGRERRFWRLLILSGLMGCIMGLVGCAFLNLADEGPKFWTNNLEKQAENSPEAFNFWTGSKMWIVIVMGTGGVVGLLRFITNFPDTIAGIFKEINSFHVDLDIAPKAVLLSVISLAGGATLGPEQALGTMGGGLGMFIINQFDDFDEDDKKLLVLAGMTGAIGALFPSPLLSVMMMYELGNPPRTNMESVTILSFAAMSAFACYIAVVGTNETWLRLTSTGGIKLSVLWVEQSYENWQLVSGFIIGIISAGLSLTSLLFIGAAKQIFGRIRMRLQKFKFLQSIIPPMIAGVIIGAVNYAMPMTVGNGNMVLSSIINYGYHGQINAHQLMCAGFARMLLLGISMNCVGFVGGFIFPTITIAIIAGVVCYQYHPGLPYGLCLACFLAGVPAGICPMPFTLACLAMFLFFFGFYQSAPILMSTITAYILVCGSGMFSAMRQRAEQAEEAAKQAEAEAQALANGTPLPPKVDPEKQKRLEAQQAQESTLSLAKYLQSRDASLDEPPGVPSSRSTIGISSQDI